MKCVKSRMLSTDSLALEKLSPFSCIKYLAVTQTDVSYPFAALSTLFKKFVKRTNKNNNDNNKL